MRDISSVDAFQSSLFWLIGHYYEYSIHDISTLIGLPAGVIEYYLRNMGFDNDALYYLYNPDHPSGYCRICKCECEGHICSDECAKKEIQIRYDIRKKGLIPTTLSKKLKYNLFTHEAVYEN